MCYTPGPQHGWFGASLDKTQHFSLTSANLTFYLVGCMEILQTCSSMSVSQFISLVLQPDDWICCYPKSGAWKGRRPLFVLRIPLVFKGFCFSFPTAQSRKRGCLCAGFTINCTYNPDFIRACTRVSFLCDPVLRCLKSVARGVLTAVGQDS